MRHIRALNISQTVIGLGNRFQDHQLEMGIKNGHVTDDVTLPRKVKLDSNTLREPNLENS